LNYDSIEQAEGAAAKAKAEYIRMGGLETEVRGPRTYAAPMRKSVSQERATQLANVNFSLRDLLAEQPVATINAVSSTAAPPAVGERYKSPVVIKRELGAILMEHIMPSNTFAASPDVPYPALKVAKTQGKAFCTTSNQAADAADVTHSVLGSSLASSSSELTALDHMCMDLLLKEGVDV
jgi:hypothetical protein